MQARAREMQRTDRRVVEIDRAPYDFVQVSKLDNVVSFAVVEHRRDEHASTTFHKSTLGEAILEFDRRVASAASEDRDSASFERLADRRFSLSR